MILLLVSYSIDAIGVVLLKPYLNGCCCQSGETTSNHIWTSVNRRNQLHMGSNITAALLAIVSRTMYITVYHPLPVFSYLSIHDRARDLASFPIR